MKYLKKMLKYVVNMVIVVMLLLSNLIPVGESNAKTLRDLKQELAQMEKEVSDNQNEQTLTETQINETYASIASINASIEQIHVEVGELNLQIEELNAQIERMDKEIKDIMVFFQISNGESAYLEYIFGAKTFTDFIYRSAVVEQLTIYNQQLMDDYNAKIIENNKKKEELNAKELSLNEEQANLQVELKKLGSKLSELTDLSLSLEDDLKAQREYVARYEELCSSDDEDISHCGNVLPPDTAFYRPVETGYITSEFGNRCFNLNGSWYCDFHEGMDLSNTGNVNIYAAAKGVVAFIVYRGSCGGNQVYIHHEVNGNYYTTQYAHLRSVYVSEGDTVDRNTVIGLMGGNPATEYWDTCTTGQHLHFGIAYGLYRKDYFYWSDFVARLTNPRTLMNFPAAYGYFANRLTRY